MFFYKNMLKKSRNTFRQICNRKSIKWETFSPPSKNWFNLTRLVETLYDDLFLVNNLGARAMNLFDQSFFNE